MHTIYYATGSDISEDIDVEDLKASSILNAEKLKHKYSEIEYESLSQELVENLMKKEVEHISGIFGVDVSFRFSIG